MTYNEVAMAKLKQIDLSKKIVIYPFGERGRMVKGILNGLFNVTEYMIIDNYLCVDYENIKSLSDLMKIDVSDLLVLITSDRPEIHDKFLRRNLYKIVPENQCIELFSEYIYEKDATKKLKNNVLKKLDSVSMESNSMIYHPFKTNSNFFLPYVYMDVIQGNIFLSDDYYEMDILHKVFEKFSDGYVRRKIIEEKGLCLDIGANIGNHTLYLANEIGVHVVAFEPIYETFRILKKNVEINDLTERVRIFNCGLSDRDGQTDIHDYEYSNIGGTSLIPKSREGDIDLKTLDEYEFKKISFIKIDVEGMEINVLKGGEQTIRINRPFIMIESFDKYFPEVKSFLKNIGYSYIETAQANYLFYPTD